MAVALSSLFVMMMTCSVSSADVIAVSALPRGTIITAEMIDRDAAGLVGKALKRPIFAGKPITELDVEAPALVTRQQAVTVTFRRRGLVLNTIGRALASGGEGESISVLVDGNVTSVLITDYIIT